MCVSRRIESLRIKVNNRELKQVDSFKYLGSGLTRDGCCTREIKMRILPRPKKHLTENCHLTNKLGIELRKKVVRCHVWSFTLYGSETWILRKSEQN